MDRLGIIKLGRLVLTFFLVTFHAREGKALLSACLSISGYLPVRMSSSHSQTSANHRTGHRELSLLM